MAPHTYTTCPFRAGPQQESKDSSCTTFVIRGEDHTLGNALRYVVAKNPKTEFCGYSIHHPSDNKVHLRIQAERQESAKAVLKESLSLLTVRRVSPDSLIHALQTHNLI